MHAPGAHAFLGFEFDNGDTLAVFGKKTLCEM